MKKIPFILGIFLLIMSAKAQSNPTTLTNIVNTLQTKYNVSISYDADIQATYTQEEEQNILSQPNIDKALSTLISSKQLTYKKLRTDYYVISKKQNNVGINYIDNNNNIKSRTITGIVTNSSGSTLPGASIVEKGTSNATITDLDGKFSLTVSDDATVIVANFIGYESQEITLTSENFYKIILQEESTNLGKVVVSGVAGATPIKKLTVTVNHLDASQLNDAPPSSAATSLQGKIPGITVVSASGSPGGNTAIRLRGVTSLNGNNSPLIIVDGIMVDTYLSDFNADDIASIEVVKGAAASALYGSKAAGGVIVINTKRGKNIKSSYQVTVRNEFGQSNITKFLDLATHHPYQLADDQDEYPSYTRYANVLYDDDGNITGGSRITTDSGYADQPYAITQNLQKQFFKTGNYYTNYVGISTKNQGSNLFISFENHHKDGIIDFKNGYSRQNFRFNADTKIGKYIKLSTSNLLINSTRDLYYYNPFDDLIRMNPDVNLFAENTDGSPYKAFADAYNNKIRNPYYLLYNTQYQKQKMSFMTNINTTIHITNWMNVNAKYTVEKLNSEFHKYIPLGFIVNDTATSNGHLEETNINSMYQTAQTTANINKSFGDFLVKSKLSYMYEDKSYHYSNMYTNELQVPDIKEFTNAASGSISANSTDYTIRSMDYFAIADIDYKSKYLFSGLIRRDGSSLFGTNVRWNNYFRVAGAYRITEDFTIPGIQELKIRAAYGTSGLRPGFSWQYETYSIYNGNLSKDQLGNKNLKPAEARELEFALDADFLNIFNFSASYSMTNTLGAFVNVPLPSTLGFSSQWSNAADLYSNSTELSLGILAIDRNKTKISFRINYDHIYQEVKSLKFLPYYTGPSSAYYIAPGESFGVLYGYKWVKSLDDMKKQLPTGRTIDDYTINSDGYVILKGTEGSHYEKPIILDTIDNGITDKFLIGDGNPDFHLGFSSTMKIHKFSFYFLIDWKNGGDVYNYTRQNLFIDNNAKEIDQYGKPDDQKKYTGYYGEFYHKGDINEYFIEDGSYVKIRELSAYYNVNFDNSNFIKSMKIGVIANNVFTFSKYSGYDPEVAYSGDLTTFAFDLNSYPHYRTISGSIQFKF